MRGRKTISSTKTPAKAAHTKPSSGKGESNKSSVKNHKRPDVSNAISLDPENPIPFDYSGRSISYIGNSRYLPFMRREDSFGRFLVEAKMLSVTHLACVTTKAEFCAGVGFQDQRGRELDKSITGWLGSINRHNESDTAVNNKLFDSFYTYGNAPVEVVKYTIGKQRFMHVYAHNFLEWRLGVPDADDVINEAVQSKLFLKDGILYLNSDQLKKAKVLPIYNPMNTEAQNWYKDENGALRTIIWLKNPMTGFPYYGMPSSVASLIYQLLEYKGARYNLDNFENNMVVAAILALKGNLGDDEANRIAKKIIKQHTGDGKRGRTVVVASEEGISGSDFHKMDAKTDGSFVEADSKWSEKIILANQWDSVLAGILSPSTLGKGSGFLTKIYEQKLNTVIRPAQDKVMKSVWKTIFKIAQEWMSLPFDKYEIGFKNSIDISGLTDVDITPAVTRNEVRKAKGLPEDTTPAGKEYMKSTGPVNKQPAKEEGGNDNV